MSTESRVILGEDKIARCWWCGSSSEYVAYHDNEWGFPVHDDRRLFEKLTLEGFQSGLSWLTILRKREGFRKAFAGFDFERVARFGDRDVERLLQNAEIVRHRGKILSAINNAKQASKMVDEFGALHSYIWKFEPTAASRPKRITHDVIVSLTPESTALSKDLKKRGWTFVGPTTVYAFMQAMGLVNDHLEGCAIRKRVTEARRNVR